MSRKPKPPKKADVTPRDLYNYVTGGDDYKEAKDAIRSIIDDEPIDLGSLENSLRDVLAAIRKIRSSTMTDKKQHGLLAGHENHYSLMLQSIVGKPH